MSKAVAFTQSATAPIAGLAPEALQIIGKLPTGALTVQALTAVPASFADLAAVRTYLNTLVNELKASDFFS